MSEEATIQERSEGRGASTSRFRALTRLLIARQDDQNDWVTQLVRSWIPHKRVLFVGLRLARFAREASIHSGAEVTIAGGVAFLNRLARRIVGDTVLHLRTLKEALAGPLFDVIVIRYQRHARSQVTRRLDLLSEKADSVILLLVDAGEPGAVVAELRAEFPDVAVYGARVADGVRFLAVGPGDILSGDRAIIVLRRHPPEPDLRLHLGSGAAALEGWINIDDQPYPGVDRLLDLRRGLPFRDVQMIFAEHLLEHFDYEDALELLRECRRVLRDDGILRISTPNLDWVLTTVYRPAAWEDEENAAVECLALNRGFRGWGHRFLYNAAMLRETLFRAGFGTVEDCVYGESRHEALRGIERHETYPDAGAVPHVLVIEASGRGDRPTRARVDRLLEEYLRDVRLRRASAHPW